MNRTPLLLLALFLFGLTLLPKEWSEQGRAWAAASVSPVWRAMLPAEKKSQGGIWPHTEVFSELLAEEKKLQELAKGLAESPGQTGLDRHMRLFAMRYAACPASVIFRDPTSWSSSLWIACGENDNAALKRTLIGENSPVLFNGAVIGVVEYVGKSSSRLRLISDAELVPAVRALRGGLQNKELYEQMESLQERLAHRSDLFSSGDEQNRFLELLSALAERVDVHAREERLAKGELHGCSHPLWRSRGSLLKGVGFNYDYADAEGPARELRTGRCFSAKQLPAMPILQEGDLLITSGLDGVFPVGLPVAFVTHVAPLTDGSYSYDIEARPVAGDLYDLQTVWVLPPTGH